MSRKEKKNKPDQRKKDRWKPLYSVGDAVIVKGSIERQGNKKGIVKRINKSLELYYIQEEGGIVGLPYLESQIIGRQENSQ